MEQLAVEVVKEFLKEQGLSRTLRAFDASLLTANAVVPGSTGGGKQKKVSKFESPQLSGTDDAVSRMLRMVCRILSRCSVYHRYFYVFCCSLRSYGPLRRRHNQNKLSHQPSFRKVEQRRPRSQRRLL